jgi:hypothetical protein
VVSRGPHISGRRRRRIAMCFWKIDRVFCFFPSGGLYRRRGGIRGGPGRPHHRAAWPGARPHPLVVRLASLCFLFGLLEASLNIGRFGFCFVQLATWPSQMREHHLYFFIIVRESTILFNMSKVTKKHIYIFMHFCDGQ